MGHVAQVGSESEQGKHAEADEDHAAPGQHQEGVDVVAVTHVLHLLLVLLLHQVAVLPSLVDLERVFAHLRSESETELEGSGAEKRARTPQQEDVDADKTQGSVKSGNQKNPRFFFFFFDPRRSHTASICVRYCLVVLVNIY